jgi:hypothetical protein
MVNNNIKNIAFRPLKRILEKANAARADIESDKTV